MSRQSWQEAAERLLRGAGLDRLRRVNEDGIAIEPLYTADLRDVPPPEAAGVPGSPPYTRGGRSAGKWQIRQRVAHPQLEAARAELLAELENGAQGVTIALGGLPGGPTAGVIATSVDDLERLFEGVDLAGRPVGIEAGAAAPAAAALWLGLARRRRIDSAELAGTLGVDPLGALALSGELPCSLEWSMEQLADVAGWCARRAAGLRAAMVDGTAYHRAGATPAQELGLALATGVAYLRQLTAAGLSLEQAGRQLCFTLSSGREMFVEIAKLRAARRCWSALIGACGGSAAARGMWLQVHTAWRTKSVCDPWVNIVRGTVECFAAAVGGADVVECLPFDETIGIPAELGRRLARNTQLMLCRESRIGAVLDPGGGSWAIEALTEQLAQAAWRVLQQTEAAGGIARALLDGAVARMLATADGQRRQAIARRALSITGVSAFPLVTEEPLERLQPARVAEQLLRARGVDGRDGEEAGGAATPDGAGSWTSAAIERALEGSWIAGEGGASAPARCSPLPTRRDAEPFERLRRAAAALAAPPRAFLANVGPIARHRARADFASNLLQAGGVHPLDNDGFADAAACAAAFADSAAAAAVICCGDDDLELAPAAAEALRQRGASALWLVGEPGERERELRDSGVDRFIHRGCDVLAALSALHETLGVRS